MARAGIENEIDPAAGEPRPGTVGDPGVLADFKAESHSAEVEDEVAERHLAAFKVDALDATDRPRFEPAGFVVQSVAGEILFRDQALDDPIDDHRDGVVDRSFVPERQTHRDDEAAAFGGEFRERSKGAFAHLGSEEQVLASVSGEGEFGQAEPADSQLAGLGHGGGGPAAVAGPVERSLIQRGGAGDEAVHGGGSKIRIRENPRFLRADSC